MSELALRQAGFSELSYQFARFIQRLDNSGDDLVAMAAALASEAISEGHVCLNLAQMQRSDVLSQTGLPEEMPEWLQRLKQSHVVGQPGDYKPLILTDEGLLYLYRFWLDEQNVAQAIRQR
ncbi:MAG: exodeoxyribonuclease V subunit alpha, partial [Gammaproteobacteria bacterium]|nr:exodeoxyribonuclease V subunit alpha [Gammaproteobacteria bacterium]